MKNVVHFATSECAERLWVVVHIDVGPVLFGVWYRPLCYGEIGSIQSLSTELDLYKNNKLGTIVCGDMNVHHKGWLNFSTGTTPEGRALFDVSCVHYVRECTKLPTRGPNLLDLTLTNIAECVSCKIIPGVSDHEMVLCTIKLPIYSDATTYRECFSYKKANWKKMNTAFREVNWYDFLLNNDIHERTTKITKFVLDVAKKFIPFGVKMVRKSCYPWLNEKCKRLVLQKLSAAGTLNYTKQREKCSQ